jgi:hypothetical protein
VRYLLLFPLAAITANAQPFSFGVKGGIPLTQYVDASGPYQTITNPYIVGLTAEVRLPFGLSLEADGLYRHLNYTFDFCTLGTCEQSKTTGNDWEFPVLAKYRLPLGARLRPFADTGIAWDTLSGLRQTTVNDDIFGFITSVTSTSHPMELTQRTTAGFVIGGGIDVHMLAFHISPEVRYTRWASQQLGYLSPRGDYVLA